MAISGNHTTNPAGTATARLLSLRDLVRVSRLGLMASHLWIFLLPAALARAMPGREWWIGALYVTLPLGMLIYGWNDFRDADVDALSGRKRDSVAAKVFGYRLGPAKRRLLPAYIVALHLPFLALAALSGRLWFFGWVALMALANWLYNGPGVRLSRRPVIAELTATWIYLNILWLGVLATGLDQPLAVWVLAGAAVLVFQLAGAIVDIEADRRVGKKTFAAAAGEGWAAGALAAVVALKAGLFLVAFDSPLAAALAVLAIPLCLARPALAGAHWAGLVYAYFVVADWLCLALIAR